MADLKETFPTSRLLSAPAIGPAAALLEEALRALDRDKQPTLWAMAYAQWVMMERLARIETALDRVERQTQATLKHISEDAEDTRILTRSGHPGYRRSDRDAP